MKKEWYPKEEIDLKMFILERKLESNQHEVMVELLQHRATHEEMIKQVKLTNGKVKKIIMALIGLGAFTLGMGLKEAYAIIALFLV